MNAWTDPLKGLRFSIIVASLAFLVGGAIHHQKTFRPVEVMPSPDTTNNARFQTIAHSAPDLAWLTINVNKADAHHLEALPGIGPVKAKNIVDYRTAHGPFRRPQDLLNVHGIGPKTLARITPLISLDTTDTGRGNLP